MGSRRIFHELPPEARSVIVGSLLGDAYLYRNGTLQIEHQLDHAAYVLWKYEKLRCVAGKDPVVGERFDSRTGIVYRSIRFYTKAVLRDLRAAFYQDRRKILPENMEGLLDPMAVAVWFMEASG